jgi:hypothetical protein
MQPIEITKFLGLRNTVSEARQPMGALTHATNILIDNSGAIIRRKGSIKVANGKISSSYGTLDNSAIYVVDDGSIYRFNGDEFVFICDGIGSGTVHWCEESSNLIFAQSALRFIAIENDTVTDLIVPPITDISVVVKIGSLPAMLMGIMAQYVNIETGLRGELSSYQTIDIANSSSLIIEVPPLTGYFVAIYGFMQDSGAWSLIGETENILHLNNYPATNELANDAYIDVSRIPKDVVAMTYHIGRICVVTLSSKTTSLVQFSTPNFYHLFDVISEAFEIPDTITAVASSNGALVLTGIHSIWAFADGSLKRLAPYGTPVGKPITQLPTGELLIWTYRGVCQYPEFKNLTENNFSVPAGFGCATSLYEHDGSKYLAIATDDAGMAFNQSFPV